MTSPTNHKSRASTNTTRSRLPTALLCLSIFATLGLRPAQPPAVEYDVVSSPSDRRELSFPVRGRIESLFVQPGDRVSIDQEIVKLDDAVQREMLALAELSAADQTTVSQAETALAYRQEELRLTQDSFDQGGASEADLRDKTYQFDSAKLGLEAARLDADRNAIVLRREQAQLEQLTIRSPIEAVVLDVLKRPGEGVDELTPVVTIIRTDPLWLDVNVPTRDAMGLRLGQKAVVAWDDVDGVDPMEGKIIFRSPAGHGGARRLLIRVEVPNPQQLPTGLHGHVRFLDPQ